MLREYTSDVQFEMFVNPEIVVIAQTEPRPGHQESDSHLFISIWCILGSCGSECCGQRFGVWLGTTVNEVGSISLTTVLS